MPSVTYKGPTRRDDATTVFIVDGVTLNKDQQVEVSDELAKEMSEGSDRLKGHKFEVTQQESGLSRGLNR